MSSHAANAAARWAMYSRIGPSDPPWTWWVDELELTRHRATAYEQMGEWRRAIPLREEAGCGDRAGYLDLAQLLHALVQVGDWERGEEVLVELMPVAGAVGSGRTVTLLRDVVELIRAGGPPSTAAGAAEDLAAALR